MRCRSVNHFVCSSLPPGMNSEVKSWRKAGFSLPQPWRIRVSKRFGIRDFLGRAALAPAARERAVQHEMADALGMAHRIGDCDRAALRNPSSGNRLMPRASTTASRSRTKASNDISLTSQSERPLPRAS
jgi:hypothetical protein